MSKPTHVVYAILPRGEGKDDYWQPIGAGWTTKNGGINLKMELVPTDPNVTIQVKEAKEKDDAAE